LTKKEMLEVATNNNRQILTALTGRFPTNAYRGINCLSDEVQKPRGEGTRHSAQEDKEYADIKKIKRDGI
jgi:hypothetical protein